MKRECRRSVIGILLAVACMHVPCGAADGVSVRTAEELLQLMKARDAIDNLHLVTVWENLEKGVLLDRETMTTHRDNLGRVRLSFESVYFDADGQEIKRTRSYRMFNGELTVNFKYNHNPAQVRGQDSLHADVYDGVFPRSKGLSYVRDSMTFVDGQLRRMLEKAIVSNTDVAISRDTTQPGDVFIVRFAPTSIEPGVSYTGIVDARQGWTTQRIEGVNADGHVLRVREGKYRQTADGHWVAVSGSYKSFPVGGWKRSQWTFREALEAGDAKKAGIVLRPGESLPRSVLGRARKSEQGAQSATVAEEIVTDIPLIEWRFTCPEVAINSPNFSEEEFVVALPPGTSVFDDRYKIRYVVGDTPAFADDVVKLSQAARTAEDPKLIIRTGDPTRPSVVPDRLDAATVTDQLVRRPVVIVTLNALTLAAIGGWWFWRSRKNRGGV